MEKRDLGELSFDALALEDGLCAHARCRVRSAAARTIREPIGYAISRTRRISCRPARLADALCARVDPMLAPAAAPRRSTGRASSTTPSTLRAITSRARRFACRRHSAARRPRRRACFSAQRATPSASRIFSATTSGPTASTTSPGRDSLARAGACTFLRPIGGCQNLLPRRSSARRRSPGEKLLIGTRLYAALSAPPLACCPFDGPFEAGRAARRLAAGLALPR